MSGFRSQAGPGGGVAVFAAQSAAPATPASGILALWSQTTGGRVAPYVTGPLTAPAALQPSFATGKVRVWMPPGAGNNGLPQGVGYNAFTAVGSATGRSCVSTNALTRSLRLGYVSASGSGSLASLRSTHTQITVGSGTAGVGGFYKVTRFGCSDAATVAGARQFVGITTDTNAPSNVEPSTLTNCVGVGHGESDTNLKIFYGGSSAQTPIDLGANFPANTLSADLYELVLFSPSTSPNVYYQVTRVGTSYSATGMITNSGATVLPAASTFMAYFSAWRSNNATALAVGLDLVSDYVEIDV